MKKLHQVARLRRLAELDQLNIVETVPTQQQPITTRTMQPEQQEGLELNNTLERLLNQSASSIGVEQPAKLSGISSIRKSKHNSQNSLDVPSVKKIRPPASTITLTLPKKDYKASSRQEIAKLKERRKELESQPINQSLSRQDKLDLERIWDEVEKENQCIRSAAEELMQNSAARTMMMLTRQAALRYCFGQLLRQSLISQRIREKQRQVMRRAFDNWYFIAEDRKEQSRRLLIMKQRIREDDELRRLVLKHLPNQ